MKLRILVTYCTNAGSTTEVAACVSEALGADGLEVELRSLEQVEDVSDYHGVVLGAPLILGWHRKARSFLRRQRSALANMPVALFLTGLRLTDTNTSDANGIPIHVDQRMINSPQGPQRLSFKEKHTTITSYLQPVLKAARQVKPVSIGFFAGKLDYTRLRVLQMLFVMLVIGARPGDKRDWDAIRNWAVGLQPLFIKTKEQI